MPQILQDSELRSLLSVISPNRPQPNAKEVVQRQYAENIPLDVQIAMGIGGDSLPEPYKRREMMDFYDMESGGLSLDQQDYELFENALQQGLPREKLRQIAASAGKTKWTINQQQQEANTYAAHANMNPLMIASNMVNTAAQIPFRTLGGKQSDFVNTVLPQKVSPVGGPDAQAPLVYRGAEGVNDFLGNLVAFGAAGKLPIVGKAMQAVDKALPAVKGPWYARAAGGVARGIPEFLGFNLGAGGLEALAGKNEYEGEGIGHHLYRNAKHAVTEGLPETILQAAAFKGLGDIVGGGRNGRQRSTAGIVPPNRDNIVGWINPPDRPLRSGTEIAGQKHGVTDRRPGSVHLLGGKAGGADTPLILPREDLSPSELRQLAEIETVARQRLGKTEETPEQILARVIAGDSELIVPGQGKAPIPNPSARIEMEILRRKEADPGRLPVVQDGKVVEAQQPFPQQPKPTIETAVAGGNGKRISPKNPEQQALLEEAIAKKRTDSPRPGQPLNATERLEGVTIQKPVPPAGERVRDALLPDRFKEPKDPVNLIGVPHENPKAEILTPEKLVDNPNRRPPLDEPVQVQKTKLADREQAVLQQLRSRHAGGGPGTFSLMGEPTGRGSTRSRLNGLGEDAADLIELAAVKAAKWGKNRARWTKDLIKDAGERVKPHLDDLWKAGNALDAEKRRQALKESRPIEIPQNRHIEVPKSYESKDIIKKIQDWAEDNGIIGTYTNDWDGRPISVSSRNIKNALAHGPRPGTVAGPKKIRLIGILPEMLQDATLVDIRPNYKTPGKTDYIYGVKTRIDGQDYMVALTVQDAGGGKFFYNHELTEMIKLDSVTDRIPRNATKALPVTSNRATTLSIIRDFLKSKSNPEVGKPVGKKTPAPAIDTPRLDAMENAAQKRLDSRKGRVLTGIPVDDIADYAIIAAAKIARGTIRKADVLAAMAKEFGEDKIKPHWDKIWLAAQDELKKIRTSSQGEAPQYAGNINLNRINSTDAVKRVIQDTATNNASAINEARRGTVSLEETRKLADDLGMSEKQLLKRRKGQALNAEEITAARDLLNTSATRLSELREAALKSNSDEALAKFQEAFDRHSAIQLQVSGATAEAGRTLSALRIHSDNIAQRNYKRMLETLGGRERTEEIIRRLSQIDPKDTAAVNKFIQRAHKATAADMIYEAWISSILSNPTTQGANILSNTLTALSKPMLESPIVAAVEAGRSAIKGQPRQRFFREIPAQVVGAVQGVKDGVRAAMKAWNTEMGADTIKLEQHRPKAIPSKVFREGKTHTTVKVFGSEIKIPLTGEVEIGGKQMRASLRALTAADEFFKAIVYRADLNAQAYRAARLKGGNVARNMAEILANPTKEMMEHALGEAEYRTFTKPLGKVGKYFSRGRNMVPGGRYVVPFTTTPTNVAKFALERTPMNFVRLARKLAKGELTGAQISDELAKPLMGTAIMTAAYYYALDGNITGAGPKDPNKRRALYQTGWQPYALKVGDKYYQFKRLEPLGSLLGMAGDLVEMSKDKETDLKTAFSRAAGSVARNITSKTFMVGLSDALDAMADPERHGQDFLDNYAGSLIPSGVAAAARAVDGKFRRADSTADLVKSRIPGKAGELMPLRDVWGREVERPGSTVSRLLSPVTVTSESKDPLDHELVRLGVSPGQPAKKIKGVKLTPKEYDEYSRLAGERAYEMVKRKIRYIRNDEKKKEVISKTIQEARKIESNKMWQKIRHRKVG